MIQLDNLTLFLGTRCIFEKACFTIFPGQKVGVIGKNGAGKSTLFALLRNELLPDKGHCQTPKSWRIAHIPQSLPEGSITALDYVLSGDNEYLTIQNKLMIAEQNDDHSSVLQAHDQLHLIDGYRIPAKAANLLKGLGFSDPSMQQAISSFSGGWRMRLNVAKTLMARADLFLLDEPTNHLDLDAIVWLEEWIKNCHATVLVITHDAAFLDAVPENILLVENKQFTVYKGNYSSYIAQKSATLALQQAMGDDIRKKVAEYHSTNGKFPGSTNLPSVVSPPADLYIFSAAAGTAPTIGNAYSASNGIIVNSTTDVSGNTTMRYSIVGYNTGFPGGDPVYQLLGTYAIATGSTAPSLTWTCNVGVLSAPTVLGTAPTGATTAAPASFLPPNCTGAIVTVP